MDKEKVRLGMVGCGRMGSGVHLVNFLENPHCEVLAVADLRPKLAQKVAESYSIPATYSSHTELLENVELDCVAAILSPGGNAIVGCDVLEAGKDLYVEKPMSTSLADAQKMVDAAQRNHALLMIAFHKRYDPGVARAKQLLSQFYQSGEIGSLLYVNSHCFCGDWICQYPKPITTDEEIPPTPSTNAPEWLDEDLHPSYHSFNNMCSHSLNLLRFLTECEPSVDFVKLTERGNVIQFDFDGVPSTLVLDWIENRNWLEETCFYFQKGWVRVQTPPPLLRNVPARVEVFRGSRQSNELTEIQAEWGWAFKREADHFIECVLNRQEPVSSGEDSLADMRVLEAIYRWAQQNR